jgi:cell division septation protein DedD
VLKIDQHISDLLYEHDCVIVPQLGGFIASYVQVSIHPVQHSFTPPSKKIAFNELLKQNDGLLASHLANTESFTYNRALKEIEVYVERCITELEKGNKFVIEQVGTLQKNVEGTLQFEPFKNVNYLRHSFGLATIQFLPIEQLKNAGKDISLPGFTNRPSKPHVKVSRKKIGNAILISGSLLWLFFNLYLVSPSKFSLSYINPLPETTEVEKPAAPTVIKKEQQHSTAPKQETLVTASIEKPKTEPATVVIEEEKETPAENMPTITTPESIADGNYFIIGGAFRSETNAQNFSASLRSAGFLNARIINPRGTLKMVCFNSFATLDEAQTELNRIKSMQKDAWIHRK